MKRRNFFSGLYVAGEDLNGALSDAEVALQQFVADVSPGGWTSGGSLIANYPTPNLLTRLPGPNIGYSPVCSYRLFATDLTVNPLITGDTAIGEGGDPDGTPVDLPDTGNEKWVSVGLVFKRLRTDKRVHPVDGTEIFHLYHESFVVRVAEGEEAAAGSAQRPLTDFLRAGAGEDGLLTGDILLTPGMTAIGPGDIHLNRVKGFSWNVISPLSQAHSTKSDYWPDAAQVLSPVSWNGRFDFTRFPDPTSRLQITQVKLRCKNFVAQTGTTTVQISDTPDFDAGDEIEISLTSGSGDSAFEATVAPEDYTRLCNLTTNETPLYWRFSQAGTHSKIFLEIEYTRID